eukprot:EC715068.1.p3 GENE.EC715068.1~~EC715068.1.p3  ORF type:complete len:51 (+),score=5.37 EC715068.1:157-309(+)
MWPCNRLGISAIFVVCDNGDHHDLRRVFVGVYTKVHVDVAFVVLSAGHLP